MKKDEKAIVKDSRSLWMMNKSDSRYRDISSGYDHVATVMHVGKYMDDPRNTTGKPSPRVRPVLTDRGTYLVFSDWSAIKEPKI